MANGLARWVFNRRNGTRIKAAGVSLKGDIGRGVKIQRGCSVDKHCSIGAHSYLGNGCSASVVKIGRYCSIGDNVAMGLGEHDMGAISTSVLFQENVFEALTREPCEIGHDVWIGAQSLILRGVRIGNGAVVGANSVVTRDVAPFEIVVGSPARSVRQRFDADKIAQIEASGWWDMEPDAARAEIKRLEALA